MRLNGSFCHHQRVSDLAVRFPLRHHLHDRALADRQATSGFFSRASGGDWSAFGNGSKRSLKKALAQVGVFNSLCQRRDPLTRQREVTSGQVVILASSVLSSESAIDLPDYRLLLTSEGATPGFLQRLD